MLLNAGLSITLFFALIQFFDPTLQEHHNQSLAHHQVHHNPLLNGLKDFAEGDKEALREQPAGDKNNTLARVVQGRERIMQLLEEAGVAKDLSLRQIEQLPLWETVSLFWFLDTVRWIDTKVSPCIFGGFNPCDSQTFLLLVLLARFTCFV